MKATRPEVSKTDEAFSAATDNVSKSDTNGTKSADISSKKRTRDENEAPEGEGPAKKIETDDVEGVE